MSKFGQPSLSHLHINTKSKPLGGFWAAPGPHTIPLWEPSAQSIHPSPVILHSLVTTRMVIAQVCKPISAAAPACFDATRRPSLYSAPPGELSKKKPPRPATSQIRRGSHQENQTPRALLTTAFFFQLLIIMVEISARKPQAWWMANLIGCAWLNISIFDGLISVGKRQTAFIFRWLCRLQCFSFYLSKSYVSILSSSS